MSRGYSQVPSIVTSLLPSIWTGGQSACHLLKQPLSLLRAYLSPQETAGLGVCKGKQHCINSPPDLLIGLSPSSLGPVLREEPGGGGYVSLPKTHVLVALKLRSGCPEILETTKAILVAKLEARDCLTF